jgi:hypothetical protein
MSSRGVFRIIGGRGAFITALFEDVFFLHDLRVDAAPVVCEELISASDNFAGLMPTVHAIRISEAVSVYDFWIRHTDSVAIQELMSVSGDFTGLIPAVHGIRISEAVSAQDIAVKAQGVIRPDEITDQNKISMSDTFEVLIEQ